MGNDFVLCSRVAELQDADSNERLANSFRLGPYETPNPPKIKKNDLYRVKMRYSGRNSKLFPVFGDLIYRQLSLGSIYFLRKGFPPTSMGNVYKWLYLFSTCF